MKSLCKAAFAACAISALTFAGGPAGYAGKLIGPGDPIRAEYTCRLKTGEIVDTTDSEIAADAGLKKSNIFIPHETYGAVLMRAGDDFQCKTKTTVAGIVLPHKEFETEIKARLAAALVGKPLGQTIQLELSSSMQQDLPEDERIVSLGRVTALPKALKLDRNRFEQQFAVPPRLGEPINIYPELAGQVTGVTDKDVEISFKPRASGKMQGEYGEVVVHEEDDQFVIEILPQEGNLVRIGPVVGKVAGVQGTMFTVDFGHPFGEQIIYCDVTAEPTSNDAVTAAAKDAVCPGDGGTGGIGTRRSVSAETEAERQPVTVSNQNSPEDEDPQRIQPGDLVELNYTATLQNGQVMATTVKSALAGADVKTVEGFVRPDAFAPAMLVAGEDGSVLGLSETALGMQVGQKKQVELPPDQAFGLVDPRMLGQYPKTRNVSKTITMSAKDYIQRFGSFPVQGKEVVYNDYLQARVEKIENKNAVLLLTPRGEEFTEEYGSVRVREIGDQIVLALTPKLGADFVLENRHGKIIADDGQNFTVDYNHPFAGQAVLLDIEVVFLTKASKLAGLSIKWVEDYDEGLKTAQKQKKPAVLVLYADWCGYSKKLLDEALPDPRIGLLKDEFVWIKIDSSKNQEYKEMYEQTSFPLTLVLGADGQIIKKINGFKRADALRHELKTVLDQDKTIAKRQAGKGA